MIKEQKIIKGPIISWIFAMILCPLGICFSVKSGFGVSMIEAPVYVLHLKVSQYFSWFTYGTSEYFLQALLLAAMCIAIRKFKWRYLLSFVTAFVFGWILDAWNFVFSGLNGNTLILRIILGVVGYLLTSFAVSLFFRTWLPLEVWELFVKEISSNYKLNMTKVKWIYDISSLSLGLIMLGLFFNFSRWDAIGIGTVVTTVINAPIIGFFTKILDKFQKK